MVLRENAWHLLNYPVEPFWVLGVLGSSNYLLGKQPNIPLNKREARFQGFVVIKVEKNEAHYI